MDLYILEKKKPNFLKSFYVTYSVTSYCIKQDILSISTHISYSDILHGRMRNGNTNTQFIILTELFCGAR